MRVIPSSVPTSIQSDAERRLFRSFQSIDLDGICFHSLRLSEHQYKAEGELDFVVLSTEGIFALEVKGGVVRRTAEGVWSFTDRYEAVHKKSEGPFDQARSGIYSLVKQIHTRFANEKFTKFTVGYGVVFPDCTFEVVTPEWSSDIVFDARSYENDASLLRFIKKLTAFWQSKRQYTQQLEPREVERIAQYLRPKFDIAPTLANRADEIEREVASLTDEQYDRLDSIERNPRILCAGGAGTGKTFLALEIARRHAERGQTVLFVCKSIVLVEFLRSRAGSNITIAAADSLNKVQPYEVLIVDEGQDILNIANLTQLDKYLLNGIEKGTWRIFYDINNQSGVYAGYEYEALEMLGSYNIAWLELHRNCRNTLNIVNQTRLLTAADLGKPAAGDGPKVNYLYVENKVAGVGQLEKSIFKLLEDDVPIGDITILSPGPLRKSIASGLSRKLANQLLVLSPSNASRFPDGHLTFATVADFKGLENKFIFMVDFESGHFQDGNLSTTYVAMTRARVGLSIILDQDIQLTIQKSMLHNYSLIQSLPLA
jgi:hypothetical protein